jgi:hypothetical protein
VARSQPRAAALGALSGQSRALGGAAAPRDLTRPHAHADLEWKVTYVGSAKDNEYDQVLESVLVGPVRVGTFRFVLQARLSCAPREQPRARAAGA